MGRRRRRVWWAVTIGAFVLTATASARQAVAPDAVLSGEWMLAASSDAAWRAVEQTAPRLGLTVSRREPRFGAIVTAMADVDVDTFGTLESAGLPAAPVRSRMQVHLHVMRDLEPARLAIGVVTETDTGSAVTARGRTAHAERRFGNPVIRQRVLREVEAVLGVIATPLAADAADRAAQARQLLPAGLEGGCGVREAPQATRDAKVERPPARTGYAVEPVYPRDRLAAGDEDAVHVDAELTEHGTLIRLALVGTHTTGDDFARAALGAFELWRFTPMIQQGCPSRVRLGLRSRFRSR